MQQMKVRVNQEIEDIKRQDTYLGPEGHKTLLKLKAKQEKLDKVVQKRKDACMDMLQFFQEKLKIKSGFTQLLNDIGINKKVFLDEDDEEEEEQDELELGMEDREEPEAADEILDIELDHEEDGEAEHHDIHMEGPEAEQNEMESGEHE